MEDKTECIEKILEFLAENFQCSGCPLVGSCCGTTTSCEKVLKEYLFGKFGFKDPEQPEEHEEPIQPKVTFRTNLDGSTELSGSPEAVAEFMRKVGGNIGL